MGLAVGGEDGELLFLEIDVEAAFLAEHDIFQYVVGVAAQSGEFAEEEDVDFLADTIDEAFVEDGSLGAGFCAGGFFGEDFFCETRRKPLLESNID